MMVLILFLFDLKDVCDGNSFIDGLSILMVFGIGLEMGVGFWK